MDGSRERIVLVCGADDVYAMHLGVMICSVLRNLATGSGIDIYILDAGMSNVNRAKIEKVAGREAHVACRIIWVQPNVSLFRGLKVSGHVSAATYLRLLIPNILPTSINKALYLDSDLVVDHDLGVLWSQDLEGCAVGAVQDIVIPFVSSQSGLRLHRELGLDEYTPYFNAGVLAINVAWWREHRVAERVFQYLHEHAHSVNCHDQDGLNAVLAGCWKQIDRRWNVYWKVLRFDEWEDSRLKRDLAADIHKLQSTPYIVHYIGPRKPWLHSVSIPWGDRYFDYLSSSGWHSSRIEWFAWRALEYRRYQEKQMRESISRLRRSVRRHVRTISVVESGT